MSRELILLGAALLGLGALSLVVPFAVAWLRERRTAEAGAIVLPDQLGIQGSRRRETRVIAMLPVRLEGVAAPCHTLDVSASGCCVYAPEPPGPGDVELTLWLPGFVEPSRVRGIVRWSRSASAALDSGGLPCIGVQFKEGPELEALRDRLSFLFVEPEDPPGQRAASLLVVDAGAGAGDAVRAAVEQGDPRGLEIVARLQDALAAHVETGATPELEKLLADTLRAVRQRRRFEMRIVEPQAEEDPKELASAQDFSACVLDLASAQARTVVEALRARPGGDRCVVVGIAGRAEEGPDPELLSRMDAVVPDVGSLGSLVATLRLASTRHRPPQGDPAGEGARSAA